ncbi:hypothetical protein [Alteromonas lipotrueiana]|uniref:hypothetical protein n=1 Tax=Alteromonas lipotrueiana TaxID=2803815 RepID=UPI001C463C26|nr:hypothetical protein [Alteromonas lipotrueiana]
MEHEYKISGIALAVYGGVSLVILVFFYRFFIAEVHFVDYFLILFLSLLVFHIVASFLALLSGIYLIKGNELAHRFALPVSVIILFSVPVGTIVGAVYLWQRLQHNR